MSIRDRIKALEYEITQNQKTHDERVAEYRAVSASIEADTERRIREMKAKTKADIARGEEIIADAKTLGAVRAEDVRRAILVTLGKEVD
jgi:hypothetical protein